MKTAQRHQILLAAVVVSMGVGANILFQMRKPESASASVEIIAPVEPLRIERSASNGTGQVRASIREMIDPQTPPRTRIDLALQSERDLRAPELEILLAEVSMPPDDEADLGWHSQYVHEISRNLHHYSEIRARFARVLVGVACDEQRSRVEREYAVQHLRQVWHRAADDLKLRKGLELRFTALASGQPAVAGPALLALHFLGNDPERPWNARAAALSNPMVEPIVAKLLATDPDSADPGTLMAAMRVAADRQLEGTEGRIRKLADDSSAPLVVRMASISILAKSGEDSQRFLRSINRTDPHVDQAVRLALKISN